MRILTIVLFIGIISIASGFTLFSCIQSNQIDSSNDQIIKLKNEVIQNKETSWIVEDDLKLKMNLTLNELEQNRKTAQPIIEKDMLNIISLRQQLLEKTDNYTKLKKLYDDLLAQPKTNAEAAVINIRSKLLDKPVSSDLQLLHKNTTGLDNLDCFQCHLDMVYNTTHRAHLINPILNFKCQDCHETIDLSSGGRLFAASANQTQCAVCHTPMPEKIEIHQLKSDQFAQKNPFCIDCHKMWKINIQRLPISSVINLDNISESDCYKCHGKVPLFEPKKVAITIPCNLCHG
ncbi:cytochrome c3 family protein [Thermoproteota archaeon]